MEHEGGGGTVCCCKPAVISLARKLTQLMDSRPPARDALRELTTSDEHVAAWKLILEMAYGVQDWTDPKVAIELGKLEAAERKRIEEIQAEISEARRRCRFGLQSNRPLNEADHVAGGTKKDQVPWVAGDRRPPRDASYVSVEGEEVIEEFFGELWAVPACHFKAANNQQHSSSNRRRLVWIRRELFVAGSFTAEDCYPARASDWQLPVPKELGFSFSHQVWAAGEGEQA
ncbi:hypothetical protein PR202_ga22732 [Eleusine coracana subsp. coracana]|uniref:Uncharacterized protein n=1 Tax=Eleusine coracana subsp. coracana TaxID=191504 RepID=A0AAV5D4S8_ELECO|nr:hypothetical protein PR202_ga22732 [Eleusine coracana subsp. coracana]